jgi:hypothetical protein
MVRRFICSFLFSIALTGSVLFFTACPTETGGDPNRTLPLPGPNSVQATGEDGGLLLQWTKVAPAQGKIPTYEVYYAKESNQFSNAVKWPDPVISNDSQLVTVHITGLENNKNYYIWVKAVFPSLGESTLGSAPITVGMPIPPPATPGPLTIYSSENMLEITWTAVANAFTYEVYYKASGSGETPPADTAATMITVSQAAAVIPGLNNSQSYTVWVKAVNTAGVSPGFATISGSPALAALTKPGTITVKPGDEKLTLTWDQVHGVSAYKLYYKEATDDFSNALAVDGTVPADAPTVSAEITGLSLKKTYYVWVQSWNSSSTRNESFANKSSGIPEAKPDIQFNNMQFELGRAAAEYIFAQDLPPSVFFPVTAEYPKGGRPGTDRLTRVQETALGDLFTDAVAWYVRKYYPTENVDFVFLNGGYIDNALPQGIITVGRLAALTSSASDKLYFVTLKGDKLKLFFDEVADLPPHTGRGSSGTGWFGIVSSEVRYTLQYYKPPAYTGSGLASGESDPYQHGFIKSGTLKINGADIDNNKNYRICTTDYVVGEYYFPQLTTAKNPNLSPTPVNVLLWHTVAAYIYDKETITPKTDGRIKIEGGVPLPPPWVEGDLNKP